MLADPAAVDVLLRALAQERYPEARAASCARASACSKARSHPTTRPAIATRWARG
jgi:hypothetical protein